MALLESAIGRPYVGYTPRIYEKAAVLAQSLIKNHGFVDGNKRTAFLVVDLFVQRSGYKLRGIGAPADEELENLILDIATSAVQKPGIEAWFRLRLRKAT